MSGGSACEERERCGLLFLRNLPALRDGRATRPRSICNLQWLICNGKFAARPASGGPARVRQHRPGRASDKRPRHAGSILEDGACARAMASWGARERKISLRRTRTVRPVVPSEPARPMGRTGHPASCRPRGIKRRGSLPDHERARQFPLQIAGCFEPHGEPNQAVADAAGASLVSRHEFV